MPIHQKKNIRWNGIVRWISLAMCILLLVKYIGSSFMGADCPFGTDLLCTNQIKI